MYNAGKTCFAIWANKFGMNLSISKFQMQRAKGGWESQYQIIIGYNRQNAVAGFVYMVHCSM